MLLDQKINKKSIIQSKTANPSFNQFWKQNQFYSKAIKHVRINFLLPKSILTSGRSEFEDTQNKIKDN